MTSRFIQRTGTKDPWPNKRIPPRGLAWQTHYQSLSRSFAGSLLFALATLLGAIAMERPTCAQVVERTGANQEGKKDFSSTTPWEYSSYTCRVWMSVSPKLQLNESAQQLLKRSIQERLEAVFGGVCVWNVQSAPDSVYSNILHRIDSLTYEQLLARETTLVIAKSDAAKAKFLELTGGDPNAKLSEEERLRREKLSAEKLKELEDAQARAASINSVRTLESALERIGSISMLPNGIADLQREITPFLTESRWTKFSQSLKPFQGSIEELNLSLEQGDVLAALVAKSDVEKLQESARAVPTRLPWQPEALLRESDKIFLVSIDIENNLIQFKVRELDSMLSRLGAVFSSTMPRASQLSSMLPHQIQKAFSTVVRIEETDPSTATLRVRAGGLITSPNHPAGFEVGDVLQPYIRRVDVNGNATQVQSIPFTFVAATERIDNTSLLYGAILTASQGSLTAAKNRRTQRIGLKVNARATATDLSLVYRPTVGSPRNASPSAASGIEVFKRVPGTEGMDAIGRTDWRGKLRLQDASLPKIRYAAPHTSKNPAVAMARQSVATPVPLPTYIESVGAVAPISPSPTPEPESSTASTSESATTDGTEAISNDPKSEPKTEDALEPPAEEKAGASKVGGTEMGGTDEKVDTNESRDVKVEGEVELNVPLYLYYIKSGDVLLARIPIVIGVESQITASLADDRRRLETEAYLKGLQSEVLDLVVRRKILEARFEKQLADGRTDEAKAILEELKRVKSFDRVTEDLIQIQNRAMNPSRGQIGPNLEKRLRSMIDSSRQLIDKWLQEDLVRKFETKLSETK